MCDPSPLAAVATVVFAAGVGAVLVWLRPDLDLRARPVALSAALVALAPAALLALIGGGGAGAPLFFALLAVAAVIDWRRGVIPNEVSFFMIASGIVVGTFADPEAGVARLIGAVAGFTALWALGEIWRRIRGIDAMGLGDAKLFAGIGAYLGWPLLPDAALVAALAGVGLALARRDGGALPFGPSLAIGAVVVWATGPIFSLL